MSRLTITLFSLHTVAVFVAAMPLLLGYYRPEPGYETDFYIPYWFVSTPVTSVVAVLSANMLLRELGVNSELLRVVMLPGALHCLLDGLLIWFFCFLISSRRRLR
jgi:hypothetical protein